MHYLGTERKMFYAIFVILPDIQVYLHMRKLRLREVKYLVQSLTASERQGPDSAHSSSVTPQLILFKQSQNMRSSLRVCVRKNVRAWIL